jgi:hypothetical protein
LADLGVRRGEGGPNLAMVTQETILEAAMVVARSEKRTTNGWMMWAFWAAGVALLLVEMNAGMKYLETGLRQNMGDLLGWAPAMGMITLKVAEQSLWHWRMLAPVLGAVPVAVLGLLLVGFGLGVNRQRMNTRRSAEE